MAVNLIKAPLRQNGLNLRGKPKKGLTK